MTSQEIQAKCKEYKEMKRLAEEAQAAADSIADELKALMIAEGATSKIEGEYKLSYADRKRTDIKKSFTGSATGHIRRIPHRNQLQGIPNQIRESPY